MLALLAGIGPSAHNPNRRLPVAELRSALFDRDLDAMGRASAQMAASDLERMLRETDDAAVARAAARAAPHVADAWTLLSVLARRARDPDRAIAVEAARAAATIAGRLSRDFVLFEEIPEDELRLRLEAWSEVGAANPLWPDVRVAALEVSVHIAGALGKDAGLRARLRDPEPEIRRAALELLPTRVSAIPTPEVVDRVIDDEEPIVALVAGQVLCEGLGFGDSAEPVLTALGEAGIERLRQLIAHPFAPRSALEVARCLIADGTARSRAAVEALAARGPRSIRPRVRHLLRKSP